MTGISNIADNGKSRDVYAIKLELELSRVQQERQFLQGLWSEKEASLTSIISEQRKVISLLESVLKNNQHLLDAMHEGGQKKEEEFLALASEIESSFTELQASVSELRKNLANAEHLLERKEQELHENFAKTQHLTQEVNRLESNIEQVLVESDRRKLDLEALTKVATEDAKMLQGLEEEINVLRKNLSNAEHLLERKEKELHDGFAKTQHLTNEVSRLETKVEQVLAESDRRKDDLEALTKVASEDAKALQDLEEKIHILTNNKRLLKQQMASNSEEFLKRAVLLENEVKRLASELSDEKQRSLEARNKLLQDTENRISEKTGLLQLEVKARDEQLTKLSLDLEQKRLSELQLGKEKIKLEDDKAVADKLRLSAADALEKEKDEHAKQKVQFEELNGQYEKKIVVLQGLLSREERYKAIINELETKASHEKEKAYGTISYQLGYSILQAGKSIRGFFRLPMALLRIRHIAKQRRVASKRLRDSRDLEKANAIGKSTVAFLQNQLNPGERSTAQPELKIAGVMDEFTYHSYAPEAKILQLHPENWENQLVDFAPDMLFIESAWQGLDGLWKTKISNAKEEIQGAIEWCKKNGVPTLFWNKEDPVHFGTFLPIAGLVDYVFTTDIDCIPKYKRKLGHNHVYLLPFAAQPKAHNPVEKYDRKDAFNFAGSYYLRYPERQRDFASLIDTVEKYRGVEIYDRNFDNPHPHYTFPEKYRRFILGKLPFSEIDKAYKGYKFGINMNTIKQSQTMFARRVFEMLASNTVVVSNFSRGVRLLFGDLVVSSDNASQLQSQVQQYCESEISYRKFRLLGLRKVFSEHTYAHRLAYIKSKLTGQTYEFQHAHVYVVARVRNETELKYVRENFERQTYTHKSLLLISTDDFYIADSAISSETTVCRSLNQFVLQLNNMEDPSARISIFSKTDYYGANYLFDLALSGQYSDAKVVGKSAFYSQAEFGIKLVNDGSQYRPCEELMARCALFNRAILTENLVNEIYESPESVSIKQQEMLAIDEFNYCRITTGLPIKDVEDLVGDLPIADQGISYSTQLIAISESLESLPDDIANEETISEPMLTAEELFNLIVEPASSAIQFKMQKNVFRITSKLPENKHAYVYTKRNFRRDELNLVLNSEFKFHCSGPLSVLTVFEFQDKDGKKIAHSMNKVGDAHALAIPEECVFVRFGLKLQGAGYILIDKLVFGSKRERPFAVIGKSPSLIVSKQYPDYDDLYKYGFVHSRVRAYKAQNHITNIFRIASNSTKYYREFEGIDIASGDYSLLNHSLSTGQFRNVLIHILDDKMWEVVKLHLKKIRVIVWVHGSEIQHWKRRAFEFKNMNDAEIKRQKRLSDNRLKFWKEILAKHDPNLHFVFVSQWLVDSTEEDLDIKIPKESYTIINNFIDNSIFKFNPKIEGDRLKVLSIRPYAKLVYANDLTVSAILELSKRPFFNELHFTIVGDGDLFDETVKPLRQFTNVIIEKRFLTHTEIAAYHAAHGIFLVPTRMDTQGVSRDEAMSSGLVPITTAVAAIPEFVNDTVGIVSPPEDFVSLANAVEYLYKNPEHYVRLSNNAAERTKRQFGFEQTLKRELSLLSQF